MTNVLTAMVLVAMGVRLVQGFSAAVRGRGRRLAVEIVRSIRWRHVWPVPIVFAVVIALAVLALAVPALRWGWWSALGGIGNPVLGNTSATRGSWLERAIPGAFIVLLLPALPLFAFREEQIFRRGAEHQRWPRRLRRALVFGLAHALVGIPIGVALALTAGGVYFTIVYLRAFRRHDDQRAALVESAAAHTCYNAAIVALVALVVVVAP